MPKEEQQNGLGKNGNNLVRSIMGALNFVGGVSGLAALAMLAVQGGQIKRQQDVNTGDIHELKVAGSTALQVHVREDSVETAALKDEVTATKLRLRTLEEAVIRLSDYKGQFDLVNLKLDSLTDRVKRIEEAKVKP